MSIEHDSDRNLNIYLNRLEKGKEFSPRDLYYFANELKVHSMYEKAVEFSQRFMQTKRGWVEDNIAACGKVADCFLSIGDTDRALEYTLKSFQYDKPRADLCCRLEFHFMRQFLSSLSRLASHDMQFGYCLIDDNTHSESSDLLQDFTSKYRSINLCTPDIPYNSQYVKNETTHFWNQALIWKVANLKNALIAIAINKDYDYLFLIDSDILIHPDTIKHLVDTGRHVVSEIFWTRWYPGSEELPQVWLMDEYTQHLQQRGETLSDEEVASRRQQFFDQLLKPGLYEVGGLGACTLISQAALKKGVNFERIRNLSFWGEDRHFCVRAVALGYSLYVDTHYPALHLYRDSDLARVDTFWDSISN